MKKKLYILLGLYCILPTYLTAREINVGMGLSIPPYVISETNSGIEYDIVESALNAVGHSLAPIYLPMARVSIMLSEHKVDAATPLMPANTQNVCYSDSHIQYQNVAVALTSNNFSINAIGDLAGKDLIAFQSAPSYLGIEFSSAVKGNRRYNEYANQNKQIHALFNGDTEIIVLDINIFYYYYNQSKRKADFEAHSIFPVFPPSIYSVGFTDDKLCKDFNRGLDMIKKNQVYSNIMKRYTGR